MSVFGSFLPTFCHIRVRKVNAKEELRALAPSRPRYALGAKPGSAGTARGWNVIVPVDVAERGLEGL